MTRTRAFLFVHLIILSVIFFPRAVYANHCAGGELVYQWVSDSTYRFYFKCYRDCGAAAAPATQEMCLVNSCVPSLNFSITLSKSASPVSYGNPNGTPLNSVCPSYPGKCQNPSSAIPGYEEWWYTGQATLPVRCTGWTFSVFVSPRLASNNIGTGNFYIDATFDNLNFQGNSSPVFNTPPIPYTCLNQNINYNFGAADKNQDSLVTELIQPRSSAGCSTSVATLMFAPGTPAYNMFTNPIQTGNTFSLVSKTGNMNFTPTLSGPSTIALRVKEYRNGRFIGTVMRDVQLNVLSACSNIPPILTVSGSSIIGGAYAAGQVSGCPEQPLNFCFDIKSSNAASVLLATDNHATVFPLSAVTYTNVAHDSIRGCYQWAPTINDTGLRTFVIVVRDSSCTSPGIINYYHYTIPVYIWPPTRAYKDTSICPGASVHLSAVNGGSYVWNAVAGGAGNSSLSCIACPNPIATPNITTSYVVVSNVNSYCSNNTASVLITVFPPPAFTPISTIVACPRSPRQLDLQPAPPTGSTYRYKWTPSTYLSNDTIYNPVTTPYNDVTYIATITTEKNCKAYDTILVDILNGVNIHSTDTAICYGQVIKPTVTYDSRYSFNWTTNSPSSTISFPNFASPTIQPNVLGKYMYVLTASFPGCADTTDTIMIEAQPVPDVKVSDDRRLCFGDTMHLVDTVTPSGYTFKLRWSPGKGFSDSTILNPVYYGGQTGIFKLKLTASTSAGCADSDFVTVIVGKPTLALNLMSKDTTICGGDTVRLNVNPNGLSGVVWQPAFTISDDSSYTPDVYPGATTNYKVRATDTSGCLDSQYVKITVKPEAIINLPDSVHIYPGESYEMSPETNCLFFTWSPGFWISNSGIQNPVVTPEKSIRYTVNAHTEFGCAASDTIDVFLLPESIIDVPNAFTPTEKINPVISPVYRGKVVLKSFAIYNRWGKKVFETNDLNNGWDGTYNGEKQPTEVYIYTLEAITYKGNKIFKQGNITLLR